MHLSLAFVVAIVASATAAPAAVCNSNTFSPFLRFADFEPARSFCVARFPVAPISRTSMVIHNAVLTKTSTQTVVTFKNDRQAATVTKTNTVYSTSISTRVNTVTISRVQTNFRIVTIVSTSTINQKREASRAHKFDGQGRFAATTAVEKREVLAARAHKFDAQGRFAATTTLDKRAQPPCTSEAAMSSQWSMLLARRRDVISTGCGCIQTPRTQMAFRTSTNHGTVTRTVTVTSTGFAAVVPKTVTVFTTVRAIVTVTRQSSVTRVQTVVATLTSTKIATTSVCSNRDNVAAPALYECTYNVRCSTQGSYATGDVVNAPVAGTTTLQACLTACNNDLLCGAVNFNRNTGACTLLEFNADLLANEVFQFTPTTNSAFDFAYISDLSC